jgi:hypothetical protein
MVFCRFTVHADNQQLNAVEPAGATLLITYLKQRYYSPPHCHLIKASPLTKLHLPNTSQVHDDVHNKMQLEASLHITLPQLSQIPNRPNTTASRSVPHRTAVAMCVQSPF